MESQNPNALLIAAAGVQGGNNTQAPKALVVPSTSTQLVPVGPGLPAQVGLTSQAVQVWKPRQHASHIPMDETGSEGVVSCLHQL